MGKDFIKSFDLSFSREEGIEKAYNFLFSDELEKARDGYYKDNAENRRMGRVGLKYSKQGLKRGDIVTATLPTGHQVRGRFQGYYGNTGTKITIKDEGGKLYGVNVEKVNKEKKEKNIQQKQRRIYNIKIKQLENEREAISLNMEEEIAQEAEMQAIKNNTSFSEEMGKISSDGNHPIVVKYAKQLSKVDKKIENYKNKY